MTFTGRITHIGAVRQVATRDGGRLSIRELRLETADEYPESLAVELTGETAENFKGVIGLPCVAYLRLRCNPSKDGSRWFNTVKAWKIAFGT